MIIIRAFINNSYSAVTGSPIEDPWQTATGNTRSIFAQIEDENVSIARFPKISIAPITPIERERIAGGKSEYRERHTYNFGIMYTCERNAVWTYNGYSFKGSLQCIKYLEYLGDKLKQYAGSFEEFNELVIGAISNVTSDAQTLKYKAILPIKVDSYGRV